ncbi:hypothetical protein ACF1BQ_042570 [Bradyrhizobium sp. RDT10]
MAAPVIILKCSRGELGLVKRNRPENGSIFEAGEKRRPRRSVRSKQIVRRIAKQLPLPLRPLHRNIRVVRTHASHRKARMWAAFHISGSRASFFLMGKRTTQLLLKDSTIAWFRLKDGYKQAITTIKLKVARGIFAFLLLYGGALASHYNFNIRDSFGDFCKPDPKASKFDLCTPAEVGMYPSSRPHASDTCTKLCAVRTEFDTRNVCTSTKVIASQTYTFQISNKDDRSFLGASSGSGGMPLHEFRHHGDNGWRGSAVALAQHRPLSSARYASVGPQTTRPPKGGLSLIQ